MSVSWNSGPIPQDGYYFIKGLLDESVGGDSRPVLVNVEYFTFAFSEDDDPESISLDGDITEENIQWRAVADAIDATHQRIAEETGIPVRVVQIVDTQIGRKEN